MEKQTDEQTLEQVADIILGEPVTLAVDIISPIPRPWYKQWGKNHQPTKRVFTITPITLGNMMRISRLLLKIDKNILKFTAGDVLDSNMQAMDLHGDSLAEIVAIAVTNTREMPAQEVKEFILWNFTSSELYGVFMKILEQMNVKSFMHTIISMRGLNVLENAEKRNEPNEVSP